MTVSAKFKVNRITPIDYLPGGTPGAEIELTPDYVGGKNADWSKWTPAGVIRMSITNPDALSQFEQGKAFTVLLQPEQEEIDED